MICMNSSALGSSFSTITSSVADTRLKKAQETIDSLKRELSEARRAEVKTNRMELDKRK